MKKVFLILNTLCVCLILILPASAYLDPSVMTYTIQIVAGVVIAAGAIIGVVWRRAKKNLQNKLGIDENTKKEIEDDVVEIIPKEQNKK